MYSCESQFPEAPAKYKAGIGMQESALIIPYSPLKFYVTSCILVHDIAEALAVPSSFQKALRSSFWLPSSKGVVSQPMHLFMPTEDIVQLFGNLPVPLVGLKLQSQGLIDCLGVKTSLYTEVFPISVYKNLLTSPSSCLKN